MKFYAGLPIALAVSVFACNNENASTAKANISAPDAALAKVQGGLVAEASQIMTTLSKKLRESGSNAANLNIMCSDGHAKNATHCQLTYSGPEVDVTLKEFFFNLARGSVLVGEKNSGAIFSLRTYEETTGHNKTKVMEVCKIKGVKAVAGMSFGIGTWRGGVGIDGMKIVLKEDGQESDGTPKYVATEGQMDMGWFGSYPSEDCEL